jgi:large conductance mechanosensitive channel
MLKEFRQFLLRGNVIDLAVGVVVGAAFGTLVASLVKNLLTPFIGMIVKVPDFAELSFTLNGSQFMYGELLNALISFLLIGATVFFFIVKPINKLFEKTHKGPPADPTTKRCGECMSEIPIGAKRCKYCTQITS